MHELMAERVDSNPAKSLLSTTYGDSKPLNTLKTLETVPIGTIQER